MKVVELIEGRGEQVIQFAKYLDSPHLPKASAARIEKLGALLFKEGWQFFPARSAGIGGTYSPRFQKEVGSEHLSILLSGGTRGSIKPHFAYVVIVDNAAKTPLGRREALYFWVQEILDSGVEDVLQQVRDERRE